MAKCKHSTKNKDKKGILCRERLRRKKPSLPSLKSKALSLPKSEQSCKANKSEKITGRGPLPQINASSNDRGCKSSFIPFSSDDRILLIGEADLSFACALIKHYGCSQVTATVYESETDLRAKYPHVGDNIRLIESMNQGKIRYGFDATIAKSWSSFLGTRQKTSNSKALDRIIFNFPHVGGKSKDVNRQVRYNQELLVSFFKHAIPCLSSSHSSSIIVTLFEGEPYTLWNIRDLARHSGLEVAKSFKFDFNAYPGYKHSRTIGILKDKTGKPISGWKGEDRVARTFVFVRKGKGQAIGVRSKNNQESSDEE